MKRSQTRVHGSQAAGRPCHPAMREASKSMPIPSLPQWADPGMETLMMTDGGGGDGGGGGGGGGTARCGGGRGRGGVEGRGQPRKERRELKLLPLEQRGVHAFFLEYIHNQVRHVEFSF